jgi:hypothetical protein
MNILLFSMPDSLLRAIEAQRGYDHIAGLSYQSADGSHHNPPRRVSGLEDGEIRPPRRNVRVLRGYTLLGRQVDVIETSRGCTFDCSFCSIIEMRGRNFHTYSFDRVLADIHDARDRGARSLFIVDDNITLNVRRFEALCQAIIDAGLNDLEYTVQATTSAIANRGERLARLMRKAGFRYVFLGIENILEEDLRFLRAESKNRERENGRKSGNATLKAIDHLRDVALAPHDEVDAAVGVLGVGLGSKARIIAAEDDARTGAPHADEIDDAFGRLALEGHDREPDDVGLVLGYEPLDRLWDSVLNE